MNYNSVLPKLNVERESESWKKQQQQQSAEDQQQNGSCCIGMALFSREHNVKLGNCISCYFLCLCIAPQ